MVNALEVAKKFHEAYERLAPSFGYETRTETRAFDPDSPNGRLMIAVCQEVGDQIETAAFLSGRASGMLEGPQTQTYLEQSCPEVDDTVSQKGTTKMSKPFNDAEPLDTVSLLGRTVIHQFKPYRVDRVVTYPNGRQVVLSLTDLEQAMDTIAVKGVSK